ncbi:thymidylate synthase [Candidatus Riesia pediculischaeffi]|uniref:Thymidylate synthase n=2 Tax=Candidatus Riesia pediculischaeffi TaxID=428411 RepID=A0A1V0HL22_9ENTR|nr:thymidylate synthase [Candidatus Riesia pediculischaeffi]ARC53519.1 thymidylate synthase [Candidatus Riesia pediculischaeffi]KIE64062.1 Thymidylate synthase [Candidatus Riesia pediculischaeffi PTSU]
MRQYIDLCQKIIQEGHWIRNNRTKTNCLTLINVDMEYDVENNRFPLITTRKIPYKSAISEMIGHIRGYSNVQQFKNLGCDVWEANANKDQKWLRNPNRKGKDDLGRIYGVQGRSWKRPDGSKLDQLKKIVQHLKNRNDNRAEIVTFYNPGEIEMGCIIPCMHTHTFSIFRDKLYLTSYQRSCDVPLGLSFNQIQCFILLALISKITDINPGRVYHKIINAHIYENQLSLMRDVQLKRSPYPLAKLFINPEIKNLKDIETWVSSDDFKVVGYRTHEAINYPLNI